MLKIDTSLAERKYQAQAIKCGCAKWVVDQSGNVYFVFTGENHESNN